MSGQLFQRTIKYCDIKSWIEKKTKLIYYSLYVFCAILSNLVKPSEKLQMQIILITCKQQLTTCKNRKERQQGFTRIAMIFFISLYHTGIKGTQVLKYNEPLMLLTPHCSLQLLIQFSRVAESTALLPGCHGV